jgi:hypothetical protein
MSMPAPEAVRQVWIVTLVLYAVVVAVVAVLLTMILITVRRIRETASAIWTTGQKVANNTIHIALLDTTNHVAGQILESAGRVVAGTASLRAHAERCPGCPTCLAQPGGQ